MPFHESSPGPFARFRASPIKHSSASIRVGEREPCSHPAQLDSGASAPVAAAFARKIRADGLLFYELGRS
jgi:hypothetical protein